MKTLESSPRKISAPLKGKASRTYRRRQVIFACLSLLLLLALVAVGLIQAGLISLVRGHTTSALPMTTVQGSILDGQTSLPLEHVPVTARIFSFETQTVTDSQGHFTLRVPDSSQLVVSTPNYEAQTIAPGAGLTIRLAPDPNETARRFMDAFLHGHLDHLWALLHPDTQALWSTQANLNNFLTRKFGPLPKVAYEVGQARLVPSWIDPDTTQTYANVTLLPVTLTLGPTTGVLTPPSEQAVMNGLFKNLPLAQVKSDGLWRVLVAGPLDREAPLVIPAQVPTTPSKVSIFMYHHVSSEPTKNALDFNLTVTTDNFQLQMDYLAQHGYHPITLTDVFNNLYYGMPLPSRPVVITFDDGYADNFIYAFPVLKAHHFVAEINVVTGAIGGWFLSWDQIREMAAWGIEYGSHTIHHVSLASVLPDTAEHELLDSKTTLEAELGHPIQFFCYPSGEPFHRSTVNRQQFITGLLYQDGYVGALLDPPPTDITQDPTHPYELNRIRVSGGEEMPLFVSILTNLVGK